MAIRGGREGRALALGLAVLFGGLAAQPATAAPEAASEDARASEDPPDPGDGRLRVQRLEIRGLDRTRREVIDRELLFTEGESVRQADVDESVQRLRNLGLFMQCEIEVDHDASHLVIEVVERWTAMPVVRFGRGGGLLNLVLGFNDINVLGRYLELGGHWEYLGGAHSFLVWHRNPRFLGERLRLAVDAGLDHRIRLVHDDAGEIAGGYFLSRRMAAVAFERELRWWLRAGAGLELRHDRLSLDHLPEEARAGQAERGLPDPFTAPIVRFDLGFGRLDHDNYRVTGETLALAISHADPIWGSGERMTTATVTALGFRHLPYKGTAGARVSVAATSAPSIQNRLYVGGFDGVRGFPDSRFSGTVRAMANLELRMPSVDTQWLVLHHVVFLDGAAAGDGVEAAAERAVVAAGLGVRVIVPRLHRIVMRADLARPIGYDGRWDFSFGVQQYF